MSEEALKLLKKIQENNFAAYNMLLYLDTHEDDKKAFKMYKSLCDTKKKLVKEFEDKFGPLSQGTIAEQDEFNWLDEPWPWEKEGNK